MVSKKFVSRVDEKLKAAEGRRLEMERVKAEELQRKMEMRKDRVINRTTIPAIEVGVKELFKEPLDEEVENENESVSVNVNEIKNNVKNNDNNTNNTNNDNNTNNTNNDNNTNNTNNDNNTNNTNNDNNTNNTNNNTINKINTNKHCEFKYMKLVSGKLIKLNRKTLPRMKTKLFTINLIETLIKKKEFEMTEIILGIMKRSMPARHLIQNKFARLYGQLTEMKEGIKRQNLVENSKFLYETEFMGSISPVRVPEFEADLDKLSRISSSSPCEEFLEVSKLYVNGIGLGSISIEHVQNNKQESNEPCDQFNYETIVPPPSTPLKTENIINNQNFQQTNFPTVISPMKRPYKDIEAETVYTPQRKSGRRTSKFGEEGEETEIVLHDEEQISDLLMSDANAAFIYNPYITMSAKKNKKTDDDLDH